jgi:hypothetical protein
MKKVMNGKSKFKITESATKLENHRKFPHVDV